MESVLKKVDIKSSLTLSISYTTRSNVYAHQGLHKVNQQLNLMHHHNDTTATAHSLVYRFLVVSLGDSGYMQVMTDHLLLLLASLN